MTNCQDCLHFKTRSLESYVKDGGSRTKWIDKALKNKTHDKIFYCSYRNTKTKNYFVQEHTEPACHIFESMDEGETDATKNETATN